MKTKRIYLPLIFLILFLSPVFLHAQEGKEDPKQYYRQFDFWLGKWEVYKFGTDTLVGHSHIETIIDGMGLLENYRVAQGQYQGKSLNKYNPAKQQWEQYWIDNSGLTLHLSGGLQEGKMVLDDTESGDPKKGLNRIAWEAQEDGSVRQTWNISQDGGATWTVVFDGEYRRISQ